MNSPIIYLSLRNVITSYYNIVRVSKWMSDELMSCNYSILKLIKYLDKEDFEKVNLIIKINKDKIIFDENFINHEFNFHKYFILIQTLMKHGVNIKEDKKLINTILERCDKIGCQEPDEYLRVSSEEKFNLDKFYLLIQLLLDNGIDIKYEGINDVLKELIESIKYCDDEITKGITELGLNKDCVLKHIITYCLSKIVHYYEKSVIFYYTVVNFYQKLRQYIFT